jgi:hypothetical protein
MQPSSQKVIPVQIDGASAPPAPQAELEQPGMLNEWWNWITLHKHAPGTYSGGQRIYPQQNPPPQPYQQQYQPQYPPQYAQPQYAQPQYAQPQYAQPQYAQPQYAQPQYDQQYPYGSYPQI